MDKKEFSNRLEASKPQQASERPGYSTPASSQGPLNPTHLDEDKNSVWNIVLNEIKKKANPQVLFWFDRIKVESLTDNTITLVTKNSFDSEWIKENYLSIIEETIQEFKGRPYNVDIVSGGQSQVQPTPIPSYSSENNRETLYSGVISTNYTFDTFVVGPSNQFAHAASIAVARNPGLAYNPVFIYGGVGLGKTHLINAIGNHVLEFEKRVCCISAEHFTNQVINSIKTGKMEELRNMYRFGCDVLMIDDIQFLSGKESTQEEFFHTFNSLYQSKKQIVLTSDKPPKDMPMLEDRLRSRFQWGIITDIQPPETETKVAILERKAEKEDITLPNEVAIFIAENIHSNIRELEGTLINISAYAKLLNTKITVELAKEVLKNIIKESSRNKIDIESIQKEVANYFGIKPQNLKSGERVRTIAFPRQIAMYLARKYTGSSYPEIGKRFGGKDHSTVIHAVKKIEAEIDHDASLKNTLSSIMSIISDKHL